MKLFFFSDTHGHHRQVQVPECDVCICGGDATNPRDSILSLDEMQAFIEWYKQATPATKIYVPGNHDVCIERGLVTKQDFSDNGIILLDHDLITIDDYVFFGSPFTPSYHNWSFMKPRHRMDIIWKTLPDKVDVLITHGPPKFILDNVEHSERNVGDMSLRRRVEQIKPTYHMFGHIHDNGNMDNYGMYKNDGPTTYINGSMVKDGHFNRGIIHSGILVEL